MNYAELHCLSNFTFLRGASHPEELVQRAAELGYQALAITDECSLSGVVCAHREITEHALPLKLIIGSEFRDDSGVYVLIATDRQAYAELSQLITRARRAAPKGEYCFDPASLLDLTDCLLLWQPSSSGFEAWHKALTNAFTGRLWLLAERTLDEHDAQTFLPIQQWAKTSGLPVVAAGNVHMHLPQRQKLQDCLTSIRLNRPVTDIREHLFCNAERHLRSDRKLKRLYPSDWLAETLRIAERCQFSLDELSYLYPTDSVPSGHTPAGYLRKLVEQGQSIRFPDGTPEAIQATIDKELALIALKKYEHYFVTLYDIVQFARRQNILCQGRGSAANSVVCYCLFLTEVNPQEVQLLFERFISEERHEPPDIDIDFESQRREEVMQYIYQRYGRDRAALAATVIRYRPRSALRDVAKSLGLSSSEQEQLVSKYAGRYLGKEWMDHVLPADGPALTRTLRELTTSLLGFPRHLSQHVGGFVIAEGALADLVPLENASMADRTVIQWDKEDLETLGLMKVDILSLGMMTAIRRSLNHLGMQISDVPREDPATYKMLQKADSVGVFQVESRAQMNMLPRLKPACYYDLVVQVSIVRPGPIHGDMVHPYLKRRNGQEAPDYPLEGLRPILERTHGVPLFQEQVIAFAMVAADFTAAEADQLRRSMASWRKKGHMHRLQTRLRDNMLKNGFDDAYIQRIQRQLEGFGEYGFPESHAASFALLVYLTAWLKCHHPGVFLAALLNSQPMGFYSPSQLINDARHHQVVIHPVDVNHSHWDHEALDDGSVRLGFRLVKGFNREAAERLEQQRPKARAGSADNPSTYNQNDESGYLDGHKNGYESIQQCVTLARLTRQERNALASANAFGPLSEHRYHARWQVAEPQADAHQPDLLQPLEDPTAPSLLALLEAPNEVDNLLEDYQSLGATLGRHPMEVLRDQGMLGASVTAAGLHQCRHGEECFVSGVVTCRQRPGTAAGVTFLTLEDETGCTNVVVWLNTAKRQLDVLLHARLLQVYGKVEQDPESGITHLIAYRLLDLSGSLERLNVQSHDFN